MSKIYQPEDFVNGTEEGEQKALMCWCSQNYTKYTELQWLHHSPNGGSRHKAEAVKFKVMGVKNGFPDLILPIPRGSWHGLFIEMKKKNGGIVSDEQAKWGVFLLSAGYGFKVCYGWEDARDTLVQYLEWRD